MFEGLEVYLQRKMKRLLLKPFYHWRAYKHGIIDEEGNLLREPKSDERELFNIFDNLIRKIKQLFMRYVPNKGIIRHKVYRAFLEDDLIKALDEQYHFSQGGVINENVNNIDDFILSWLNNKKF